MLTFASKRIAHADREGKPMLAFFTDWGTNARTILFLLVVPLLLTLALPKLKGERRVLTAIVCVLLAGLVVCAALQQESGDRRDNQTRRALESYDWVIVDAGSTSRVQVGDCIVRLQRVKLDGDRSLFAIGEEAQAQALPVVYKRVVELCSTPDG